MYVGVQTFGLFFASFPGSLACCWIGSGAVGIWARAHMEFQQMVSLCHIDWPWFTLFSRSIFFYLKVRVILKQGEPESKSKNEGESRIDIFWLIQIQNGHIDWSRAILKPKARKSMLVFHMGVRGLSAWVIFCCLPRTWAESWIESGPAKTGTGVLMGCRHGRERLNPLCHNPSPQVISSVG